MLWEAYWSAGELEPAQAVIEEALTLAQALAIPRLVVWIALRKQFLDLHRGRYLEAQALAQETLAVTREMGEQYWISRTLEQLGMLALVRGQLGAARQFLEDSVVALQQANERDRMPIILAALVLTKHRLENRPQARKHVFRALEIAAASHKPAPLFQSLPLIAAVLADADDVRIKERAVELYALAMSDPAVANSQFFEDVACKHVAAAAANLPPETVVAAQERGRALDWREAAAALHGELQVLDWRE